MSDVRTILNRRVPTLMTTRNPSRAPREGLTWSKIQRFLALPFRPRLLQTYLAVEKIEDVSPQRLIADGVKGVLIDADGTLGPHKAEVFQESKIRHIQLIAESGLKVAIFTNAAVDRFQQLPGIPIVGEAPAKPDRRGFETAMKNCLNLDDPASVCMIGDNYLTDGGAVGAGMRFIYVRPVPGNENFVHRLFRLYAYLCARWHFPEAFQNLRFPGA